MEVTYAKLTLLFYLNSFESLNGWFAKLTDKIKQKEQVITNKLV